MHFLLFHYQAKVRNFNLSTFTGGFQICHNYRPRTLYNRRTCFDFVCLFTGWGRGGGIPGLLVIGLWSFPRVEPPSQACNWAGRGYPVRPAAEGYPWAGLKLGEAHRGHVCSQKGVGVPLEKT